MRLTDAMEEADYQLLLLAGQAAGIPTKVIGAVGGKYWIEETKSVHDSWNPLKSDADAFRLAVQMGMINPGCFPSVAQYVELENPDWCAATRRAIVATVASNQYRMNRYGGS